MDRKMSGKFYVSAPYIYPVCPLSIDHARMFVIADVLARYNRLRGARVCFPIASHYSGNTAHRLAEFFCQIYSDKSHSDPEARKTLRIFRDVYDTPEYALREFTCPINILDFYSQEILWELKSLDVSCDFKHFYTTKSEDFSTFVRSTISRYQSFDLVIGNGPGNLALDYDKESWRRKALEQLQMTNFIQCFHKANVLATLNNVRSRWRFLRDNGFGVNYYDGWVVDPMFDSELFTIFDLFERFRKSDPIDSSRLGVFFANMFEQLRTGNILDQLVQRIAEYLPCDMLVCEEHLKNWIVKRAYAESVMLDARYRTRGYFITGMGILNGKRMSASSGNAILIKDLIKTHGPTKSRLIILLTGGHPSKTYNFDPGVLALADSLAETAISFLTYLVAWKSKNKSNCADDIVSLVLDVSSNIDKNIERGYFRQAIIELLSVVPRKYSMLAHQYPVLLLSLYEKYLGILVPGLWTNTQW